MRISILLLLLLSGCIQTPCEWARQSDTGLGMVVEHKLCE
jgi:hypothetical protein